MRNDENPRMTITQVETIFQGMLNGIGDSQSDLACSNDEEVVEDEDDEEDTEHGELCKDDEPGWVMGTISKPVQHLM
jgi:hypothetical protein